MAEAIPGLADPTYAANDPHLLFWVYATLVDSSLHAYTTFLPPLDTTQQEQFYQESKVFARLMGIDECILPATLTDFRRWMDDAIAGNMLTITQAAREIAESLLKGPSYFVILRPATYVFAAGMLPPKLCEAFGLPWNPLMRTAYATGISVVRLVARVIPGNWRALPAARRAERMRRAISSENNFQPESPCPRT